MLSSDTLCSLVFSLVNSELQPPETAMVSQSYRHLFRVHNSFLFGVGCFDVRELEPGELTYSFSSLIH